MSLSKPLGLTVKNGDRCAFIQWSAVQNATMYEIQIKNQSTWIESIDQTNDTHLSKIALKNGECYLVQVIAMNGNRRSEPSISLKIRPRLNQGLFNFSAKSTKTPGRIRLKWTAIPTNVNYHIERCDIGHANKYNSVTTITDNKISVFEDQTSCDLTKHFCSGHHYKISASDAIWLPNGSKTTAKVFCIRLPKSTNSASSSIANVSILNSSAGSAVTMPLSSSSVANVSIPNSSAGPAATLSSSSSLSAAATTTSATQPNAISFRQLFSHMLRSTAKTTSSIDNNLTTKQDTTNASDKLSHQTTTSAATATPSPSISVCQGDLITQQVDVIVVCSSSEYLCNAICKAGGDLLTAAYKTESKQNTEGCVIAIKAEGQLASKMAYFLPWKKNSDTSLTSKSIKKFVSDAVEKAVIEKYQSIAFPAIGCGKFGCSISLVAQAMVEEAHQKLQKHAISITFVIQPERTDIYDEFRNQNNSLQQQLLSQPDTPIKTISVTVNQGIIEVVKGDITAQKVDVVIGSSSSEILKQGIIRAAGDEVQTAYSTECKNNSNAILISTPPGNLPCQRIFFVKWQPDANAAILQQSLVDLIWTVIQNVIACKFTSLAFPAIGCGKHGCSVDIVVKTIVEEMKKQLTMRNIPLTIKFVIQPDQQNIYDEFCKQVLTTENADIQQSVNYYQLPTSWEKSQGNKMRFELSSTSNEYKTILDNFDQAMKGKYTQIIRLERIQNERWYIQYLAHSQNFKTRLNMDTEKYLYHGCPELAANLIMEDCFNRSFAGVNGTAYGVGVYFSSNAAYSHGYTKPNGNGERNMFLARVLVGNTTKGNGSMKTRPVGFDSTTDGNHIFVTYHDAQAYAEYLITYK